MTRVVVAGAGIGGLTLGIALARAGVKVDLYERADELREVGAAVALSANGTRLALPVSASARPSTRSPPSPLS